MDLAPTPTMPVTAYRTVIHLPVPAIPIQLPTMPVQEHIRRSARVNKGQTNRYQDFVQQIWLKLEDTSPEDPSTMYANINNASYHMMYNQM